MATADSLPSSQRRVPGSVDIPLAKWPIPSKGDISIGDASEAADKAVDSFNTSLSKGDYNAIADLFVEGGYWRDHLAVTWDFRTVKGRTQIVSFLEGGHRLTKISIDKVQVVPFRADASVEGIQVFINVFAKYGTGPGVARLIHDDGQWKIWTFYTTMNALSSRKESIGPNRPIGAQHGYREDRRNWVERRQEEISFENRDPDVLIIGCGQAGLSVHARLKMLNVATLAIDVSDEVGDAWRKRYHQLVLHDPVWYDHMPYLKFPEFWPVFTPKDKMADFLKSYAEFLELNVWNSTSLESSSWDGEKKQWTVVLKRKHKDGAVETRTMYPKHIIQATGHSGKKNFPEFKGVENFKGDVLCHSSDFRGAKKNTKGRKAVVIGACNSAMDISQDFYESGYDVTVVQRSSTTVMSSRAVLEILLSTTYYEGGPPVEEADLLTWSSPSEVYKAALYDVTALQQEFDQSILEGLNRVGFETDKGPMDCGLWAKYMQRGGGYYIDVGTSQLIIDGKVKVHHGASVAEILPYGVRLDDGIELEADEIVCATGYQNMRTTTEAIFGEAVASKVPNVWGYDKEGEANVMWRPSGHPGLWLHGGNLAVCRYFSRLLAVQIAAQLDGISPV
ncbi:FAD/NAD(P)-binding domain-containing protein [Durotheca rogersii]|uniref:FAD/NAD(P)-binding domain-containing protein n=1 Tax=Durotheca rogersii TaxID=419775 RepID=UPI00221F2B71|nr:FAD/NAD(P)-binding domain-containing protein [Durotheca rogersii]KAI5866482.1 FAD/NAD(P)-binding domain-containing protein [Durotheca rogersii]